ncbi:MAG TPA: TolC family protein [Vicinamibacterales bacterium]|nr:TolC family protein [Vicinamibacterales bacterium]
MRPVRAVQWALALLLLIPRGVGAQEPLSLEQAVALARAHNPAVRASRAGARQAADHVDEARAGWLPHVDYTEGWQRGDQPVFVFSSLLAQRRFTAADFAIDALNNPAPINNYHSAVSVEQRLFDGGRLHAAVRSAEIGRTIADQAVTQMSNDIGLEATRAYGAVLAALAGRRAAEAAVQSAREDLAHAEHRRDVGVGPEADVLALQVHLAQMQERQIQRASDEAIARARLNQIMGVALETPYVLSEPPLPAATHTPLEALEQEALAHRPEVGQAASRVALARSARGGAEAGWWPEVSVQGGYELDGAQFDQRASSWTVGAQLRWNVFAGGADLARIRASGEAEAGARANRDQVEAAVRLDVLAAVRQLDAARARVTVGQAAVAQALESQRMIRDRYDAGLATVSDVLRAATAVLDARSQRTAAEVDAWTSAAALDHALGR